MRHSGVQSWAPAPYNYIVNPMVTTFDRLAFRGRLAWRGHRHPFAVRHLAGRRRRVPARPATHAELVCSVLLLAGSVVVMVSPTIAAAAVGLTLQVIGAMVLLVLPSVPLLSPRFERLFFPESPASSTTSQTLSKHPGDLSTTPIALSRSIPAAMRVAASRAASR